jgi:prepilin-type N-terminal cleavage/methylation domain-containing protein
MTKNSKKAFTLVELIVSIAIIALISITLLGFVVPAANQQATAEKRNIQINAAAAELEKKIYGTKDGNTDLSSSSYIEAPEDHSLSFQIGTNTYTSNGTLYTSRDDESGVEVREFVPGEE